MQTETMPVAGEATDTFPINGTDYVEFYVGNAKQAATTTARPSASSSSATAAPRPAPATAPATCSSRTRSASCSPPPLAPDAPDRRARAPARRRRPRHRALGGRRARGVRDGGRAGRQAGAGAARCCRTTTARSSSPAIRTYGDTIHCWSSGGTTAALFLPGFRRGESRAISPAPVGLQYVDHCVGNVELGKMNNWVEFYERRDGLPQPALVRRQGHLDRVLVADVEGGGQRQRPDQVPDQRAGRRARRSRRSTSTSSSTAAPACSTSRSRPTTSSRR